LLFITFINDLDDGVVNKFIKFADDTKIVSKVASEDQIKILQSDLVGVIFRPYRRKSSVTICYFPSMRTEIYTHVYAIFRPHGRKFTVKFRYFPSVQTENNELLQLISVQKSTVIIRFFSVCMDENLQLNFAIFRPFPSVQTLIQQMSPHYYPKY